MSYRLSGREVKALENAKFEHDYLQGDFCSKAKLGPGIGEKTIKNLVELGLMEIGYSEYHHESNCVRITSDGERCLYGGLTLAEILERCPDGQQYHEPRVKRWPVIEKGVFR